MKNKCKCGETKWKGMRVCYKKCGFRPDNFYCASVICFNKRKADSSMLCISHSAKFYTRCKKSGRDLSQADLEFYMKMLDIDF